MRERIIYLNEREREGGEGEGEVVESEWNGELRVTRPLQGNKVSGEVTVFYPQMEGKTRVAGMSHANSLVRSQGGQRRKRKNDKGESSMA